MIVDTVSLHFVPQLLSTLKCFLDSYSLAARTPKSTLVHRHWTGSWAMTGTRGQISWFPRDMKSYLHWRSDCWSLVCLQASVSVWLESWSHTCSWQHRKYMASWITSYWRKCFPFQGKRSSSILSPFKGWWNPSILILQWVGPTSSCSHEFFCIILYTHLEFPEGLGYSWALKLFCSSPSTISRTYQLSNECYLNITV